MHQQSIMLFNMASQQQHQHQNRQQRQLHHHHHNPNQNQNPNYRNHQNQRLSRPPIPNRDPSTASSQSSSSNSTSKNNSEYTALLKEMAKISDSYLKNKGYEVTQQNGQRVSVLAGVELPDDNYCREVFVGKLPRDMLEIELHTAMERIGPVYKIRLMMDFSCGNRGYAFVVFLNPADAAEACRVLDNTHLRPNSEKRIGVCPSFDNKCLWIGNLPASIPREKLVMELNKIVDGIETVKLPECSMKRNTRFATVKFKTHEDATKARRVLCPGTVSIMGHKIRVDWAKPDQPIMSPPSSQLVGAKHHDNQQHQHHQQQQLLQFLQQQQHLLQQQQQQQENRGGWLFSDLATISRQPIGSSPPAAREKFMSSPFPNDLNIIGTSLLAPIGHKSTPGLQDYNQLLDVPEINNNLLSTTNFNNNENILLNSGTPTPWPLQQHQQTIEKINQMDTYLNLLNHVNRQYIV